MSDTDNTPGVTRAIAARIRGAIDALSPSRRADREPDAPPTPPADRERPERLCDECNLPFEVPPGQYNRRYCSPRCHRISKMDVPPPEDGDPA